MSRNVHEYHEIEMYMNTISNSQNSFQWATRPKEATLNLYVIPSDVVQQSILLKCSTTHDRNERDMMNRDLQSLLELMREQQLRSRRLSKTMSSLKATLTNDAMANIDHKLSTVDRSYCHFRTKSCKEGQNTHFRNVFYV